MEKGILAYNELVCFDNILSEEIICQVKNYAVADGLRAVIE